MSQNPHTKEPKGFVHADGLDELESHASFLMLEFAAALLGEMERWMLTASPVMIDLNTFADTSDKFLGPSSMFGDMQKRFPTPADEVSFAHRSPSFSREEKLPRPGST